MGLDLSRRGNTNDSAELFLRSSPGGDHHPPVVINWNPQRLVDANPDGNTINVVNEAEALPRPPAGETTEEGLLQQQQAVLLEQRRLCDMNLQRLHDELYRGRYLTPQDFQPRFCETRRSARANRLDLDIRMMDATKLERRLKRAATLMTGPSPVSSPEPQLQLQHQHRLQHQHQCQICGHREPSPLPYAPLPPEAGSRSGNLVERSGETTTVANPTPRKQTGGFDLFLLNPVSPSSTTSDRQHLGNVGILPVSPRSRPSYRKPTCQHPSLEIYYRGFSHKGKKSRVNIQRKRKSIASRLQSLVTFTEEVRDAQRREAGGGGRS
ncbi:hypothetical protein M378DRAFT_10849 [Amanita muscaria Koide BX008]|uniref:Uncharacterized protein n=1 Tax=Amanita muscaria (strain Koide BX008) TaxID=946122 RepID=A0A0C2TF62_AMAMK|nr:hypothetical protein M378DRAFT_10849 [Amanita muscaria Koide BX008]